MPEGSEYHHNVVYGGNVHLGNIIHGPNEQNECTIDKFLSDLFLTDASADLDKTRRLKGERAAGTCEWLLKTEEFQDWLTGTSLELLWLTGVPGIGKTVISCFVVEELQRTVKENNSVVLIYYFCDNKDEQRRTPIAILRGILFQLLKRRPELFKLIEDDYKIQKASIVTKLDTLWRALDRMLQSLVDDKVYILIDALDECEESSRGDFLALLGELGEVANVKILITGRPELDIEETAQSMGRSLRIDSGNINEDLSQFINIQIAKLQKKKKYPLKLINDIKTTLQHKAGGTFLWASLVLKDIEATKTSAAARKKLEGLPSDLSEVYKRILKNISGDDIEGAMLVLQWVVVARRPMTVCELATAQVLASGDWDSDAVPPSDLVDERKDGFKACGSLLYHDPENHTINLIHQSAKDYLVGTDCESRYRVNREMTSLSIVKTCWEYLSKEEFSRGDVIVTRTESNELQPRKLSRRILETYGFLGFSTEELRDGVSEDRFELIVAFICQCESLHSLPSLRDFWFITFMRKDYKNGVQALIKKEADLNVTVGRNGMKALHIAASNGNGAILGLLLAGGVNVMSRTENGETALHLAAEKGFKDICGVLIEKGADLNAKTLREHDTALHLAAGNGHLKVASLLLEKGANINEQNKSRCTALFKAVEWGRQEMALLLSKKGADIMIKGQVRGDEQTALFPAAATGCCAIVKLLVETGIEINEESLSSTPLSEAAENGHEAVAQQLIDEGADLKWRHPDNQKTLLSLAAEGGHKDMLEWLVRKGLDVDATAHYENWFRGTATALQFAAVVDDREMVKVLIKAGADLGIGRDEGTSPLQLAAQYGRDSVVEFLLEAGGDVNESDNRGWTALHRAARDGRDTTVSLLIGKGADINARASDGQTALHVVSQEVKDVWRAPPVSKIERVLQILLEHGACIEARDCAGRTPLFIAVSNNYRVISCILLNGGAHTCTMSGQDQTGRMYPNMDQLLKATQLWRDQGDYQLISEREAHSHYLSFSNDDSDWPYLRNSDDNELQAAKSRTEDLLRLLFEVAAYILAEAEPTGRRLVKAAKEGYITVVSMLLAKEADGSIRRKYKRSALRAAAGAGHEEIVRAFHNSGVKIKPGKSYTRLALDKAASNGHASIVRFLLENGAKVDTAMYDDEEVRWTPLLRAAAQGHQDVVQILLDGGANILDYNSQGSVLELAIKNGDDSVAQVLLNRGASVIDLRSLYNLPDFLMLNLSVETMVALLQLAVDLKINILVVKPLSWAMSKGQDATLRLLGLDRECFDIKGKDGQILLTWAIEKGYDDVINCLLEKGVQMNVPASEMLIEDMWLS
ncbi:hypothetical protein B7463_g5552, partial [Scytalidium lignicola]